MPAGELFVMGDNRDNSRDSRFWGILPQDQVKGRALLFYWSYEATPEEYHRTGFVEWEKHSCRRSKDALEPVLPRDPLVAASTAGRRT